MIIEFAPLVTSIERIFMGVLSCVSFTHSQSVSPA